MRCGTCGNCGGMVSTPDHYYSKYPPTPRCESCGATPKHRHGPVIEMEPPPAFEGKDRQFKRSIYST